MIAEVMEPRSGVIADVLPCGFVDAEGGLHQQFVVREMTGSEEDLLAGKGPVLPRLNRVIANCLVSLGAIEERSALARIVDGLTATDRMVLLIAIRRASLGDDYTSKIKCPDCSKESNITVSLADLEKIPMPDPKTRNYLHTLSTGMQVGWHVMTGHDEDWLQGQRKRANSDNDLLTLAMLARVDSIGKGANTQVLNRVAAFPSALAACKALLTRERNELRQMFTEIEGSVDTVVEYGCPSCNAEFRGDLDVAQTGFFFPAATPKR